MHGGGGNDWLTGDGGSDRLFGEAGEDTLEGYGMGERAHDRDLLDGGPHADTCYVYSSGVRPTLVDCERVIP